MSCSHRPLKLFLLAATLILLPHCADKGSDEYVHEGIEFTNQEKYDRAEESYLKAIEKSPDNPKAYYGLGGIYNYKQMYPDAEQAFKRVIRIDPTHHNAHYSLGYTYEMMGRKEEAGKEYQKYRQLKKKFDALVEKDGETR